MKPLKVGIGGPVGSGKTALIERLCKAMRDTYQLAAITNDIYTREDAEILARVEALPQERIVGVETGGCPHTAIREDISENLEAMEQMTTEFPDLDILFLESGGDNLAAFFSPELVDAAIYVIDVAGGGRTVLSSSSSSDSVSPVFVEERLAAHLPRARFFSRANFPMGLIPWLAWSFRL